ncbi:immunoglobulin-like domain-containing protein [Schaalia sp. ZJ1691]|uniref:immunoglobulin-like domain-containing protein n=1 Tax=Schaalia sp. ZJ1691 TaxID=2709404 RepID=UPI0019814CA7|nr:immunoglobulin-like domain-containing protein [Schaalia sp. ZJ1691]
MGKDARRGMGRTVVALSAATAIGMSMLVSPLSPAWATVHADADDAATQAGSAEPSLVASWDFTGKYGSANATIPDSTGTYNMTLRGGAYIEKFGDRNHNESLQLKGGGQYAEIDSALFANIGDSFTMKFLAKSRHQDHGNYFTFGVGPSSDKYLFTYLSTSTVKAVISNDRWNNEQGGKVAVANNDNIWHTYTLTVDGTRLSLLRDDELLIHKADTGIRMSDLGGYLTYIGKSLYAADVTWNGAIDDLEIYKGAQALTLASSVTISGASTVIVGDSTQLTANVTPADALDSSLTWTSSNADVATVDENGVVKGLKPGSATITAQTAGKSASGTFTITVADLTDDAKVEADLALVLANLKTVTTENLPLVVQGKHGTTITWTTSNPALVTQTQAAYQAPTVGAADPYHGGGIVTRPEYGNGDTTVTVTATVTSGLATATKSQDVTIKEKTRVVPDEAYAAVTFLSDQATTNGKIGEALYESATDGNNFFSFKEINNSNPVIVSNTDTTGLRDPYVLKSHDGDKYYMIATDLRVSKQGWGQNQQYGSLKLQAWESTDMVNWTRTNAEDGDTGITVNAANMGMTWAPEAFWDDTLGAYVVFWSSREYTDSTRSQAVTSEKTGWAYNILAMAITRDFRTFTPALTWQDTGYSRIDSTVFKIGDYYYRLTKNEEGGAAGEYITTGKSNFLERSKVLTAPTTQADPNADPTVTWQLLDDNILPFEGPESIRLNPGDPNQNEAGDAMIIMADSGGYQPFMTSESALAKASWTNRLSQTEGWGRIKDSGPGVTGRVKTTGMPTPERHGAFVNVPAAVAQNMHRWTSENPTTVDPTASTTSLDYAADTRLLTATVTAADKGSVAGNVTFSQGTWSKTVALSDGAAKVTVPDSVTGTVSAAYDGYTDGLVKASTATVDVESGETLSGDATLRQFLNESTLVADFTFNSVKAGQTEAIADETGASATINGSAAVTTGKDGSTALKISRNFWLDVTKEGASPLKGKRAVTISYDSKPEASGNVGWVVFANRSTGAPSYGQEHYLGTLDKTDTLVVERYANSSGGRDTRANVSGTSSAEWKHVDMVFTDEYTALYINGHLVQKATPSSAPTLTDILSEDGGVFYVGKATWGGGEYYAGGVDNLRIYDSSTPAANEVFSTLTLPASTTESFTVPTASNGVTFQWSSDNSAISIDEDGHATVTRPASTGADAQVNVTLTRTDTKEKRTFTVTVPREKTAAEKAQAALDAVEILNADDMRGNFSVPTTGRHGSTITWSLTDTGTTGATLGEGINASSKLVTLTRPAAGSEPATLTLTATVTVDGESATKDFVITVTPLPAGDEKDEAYVWAFFTGEGVGGEKISLAASRGNDALHWNTLNNGTPLFTSTFGEKGLRDPFIMKSHDGDKFYMIATDLKISGRPDHNGLRGFGGSQANGSLYIEVWESTDLVHWSKQRHVKVSSDVAGNTWAPEAYWDDSLGQYVVYWASNLYPDTNIADRSKLTYNRMMYATTADFVHFSEPKVWIDTQRGNGSDGLGSIDVSVQKDGDTYYRVYKDERTMTLRMEKSTDLRATVSKDYPSANAGDGQWSTVLDQVGISGEGPSLVKANAGDVNKNDYYLFIDEPSYHGKHRNHYIPFTTTDIAAGAFTEVAESGYSLPQNSDGGKPRHGTVLGVTRAQYEGLLAAYAPKIAVASVEDISVATQVASAPTLPTHVTLTKGDGSTEKVAVMWDSIDEASYAKAGTFTVTGIAQDASRKPVTATVTVNAPDDSDAGAPDDSDTGAPDDSDTGTPGEPDDSDTDAPGEPDDSDTGTPGVDQGNDTGTATEPKGTSSAPKGKTITASAHSLAASGADAHALTALTSALTLAGSALVISRRRRAGRNAG